MDLGEILATITGLLPPELMKILEPIIAKITEFISGIIGGGAA